jgi:hypothetical protein
VAWQRLTGVKKVRSVRARHVDKLRSVIKMANRYPDTVISFFEPKCSALFFKHVIPIFFALDPDLLYGGPNEKRDFEQTLHDLLPRSLAQNAMFADDLNKLYKSTLKGVLGKQSVEANFEMISDLILLYNLSGVPMDVSKEMISDKDDIGELEVRVALSSKHIMRLNEETVTWKQIMEFRRDTEAKEKLRRFRLFTNANYRDKTKEQIEYDLQQRVDDYEAVVKKWGFETAEGALNILATSKIPERTGVGALISAFCGVPLAAVFASVVGTVIELGRVGIYVGKQRFELQRKLKETPVSYLSYAKQELGSAETP